MSTTDPSVHCDCRSKILRNVRIGAAVAFLCALVLSTRDLGAAGTTVCAALAGLALGVYGVATMLDETATFPRWLYAGMAMTGGALAVYHAATLFT